MSLHSGVKFAEDRIFEILAKINKHLTNKTISPYIAKVSTDIYSTLFQTVIYYTRLIFYLDFLKFMTLNYPL